MIIFEKEYCDESLVDLQEDLYAQINGLVDDGKLEQDDEYFIGGRYVVQVVWKDE